MNDPDPREPSSAAPRSGPSDAQAGALDAPALGAFLNTLLEAERAGARVGAALVRQAPDAGAKALSQVIQADEARWCRMLMGALERLGVEPSGKVGDFYDKAMAIEGFDARLAFVNRGQGWVVRKLAEVLPKVRDAALRANFAEMLEAHEHNIRSAEAALAERRGAGGSNPGQVNP